MDINFVRIPVSFSNSVITIPCEKISDVSDGYHTFGELYEHRCLLFLLLSNQNSEKSEKSRKNSDGSEWSGWFVLSMFTEAGQISYHLPENLWEFSLAKEVDVSRWDGHTSKDVVERMKALSQSGIR